jgi:hypothetical protein
MKEMMMVKEKFYQAKASIVVGRWSFATALFRLRVASVEQQISPLRQAQG